ncbi:LOW QUALITY PROTEIN: nodal modulator 1-like [Phalaenopsis equestris]|uniref:LOW QUALITY PROTEIN: nodal modulator 1-like n=3 Tax=Phalaenopsis equestris TaxID=78828 RepID=UPI0009E42A79|nr:LOW QUALITY PROTEIN: nodal modulator 1-like [Phalaenopsis equestris]
MAFANLLLSLLLALSAHLSTAESIYGCGGFVEASSVLIKSRKPYDRKQDYSHVTVELQTIDGLVKDRTQCAPNGYYFIPVYDKGSFIVKVKGPDGWSWEPDKVPVIVDDSGCNSNADVNFQFTGFMVSGRVLGAVGGNSCPNKSGGPSNVKIELLSIQDDVIATSFTSETGHYSFTNIIPGVYKLRASHPNLGVELRGSSEVNLGFENTVVDDIFYVPGYDLHGFVVSQGNPILGVHIYLYSDDVLEVHCPQGVGNPLSQKKALCHSISNSDGKFTFNSLPCGVYDLLPYYKGENTVFDVSPPSMTLTVEHHHVTVSQKFQVTGFSVGGRVVDGNGGVSGASIIVDGQQKATSDNEGFYKLDQVTSKHYTIVAEKDHYKFSALENFLVLPNMASINDIIAIYYDVCGVVRVISPNSIAKVALTHGPDNFKPQAKLTMENGSFCFLVPPGEYRLSALALSSDTSSSPLFSPPYIDIKVNSPLLDIEFFEAQVNIHGSVLCKQTCGKSVSVALARLVGVTEQERKMISLSNESGDFVFQKIFPGKYRIMVKHISTAATDEDSWCWERNIIDLDVGTQDVKDVVFVQKGYWVRIVSTHDTEAQIEQPDSSRIDLLIKKGSQKICLQNPGEHELHFLNSCIFFGSPSLKFNTMNLTLIYVNGDKYHLRGEIHIDSNLLQGIEDPSKHLLVDIFNKDDAFIDTTHVRHVLTEEDLEGTLVFEYSFWLNLGEETIFVPQYSSSAINGKKILFYPRKRHVSVTNDGCQAAIPIIVGRMGMYVEGSVSPPLDGVNIRIIAAGESIHSPLRTGDLALVTETGADGSFSAGPLFDDIRYTVEASKPGYHVKQVGPNSFTCQKLGKIVVNVHDSGETVGLFPSVLLSLSGEDGYRNNSVSGAGGTFTFENLFSGSFYLRPVLKEYAFSPSAVAIDLESGDSKEVFFHAKRVAYSVLGTVTLISGQPKERVIVEARSESHDFYEEATTDDAGSFRLRSLLPDITYTIKLASKEDHRFGSSRIERFSPDHLSVKVGTEDVTGADFVVFEEPETTILSGHVQGYNLETLQPHLSIEIRSANDPSEVESVIPLPISYYFQIRDLAKGRHLLQLRPGLDGKSGKFESEVLEVDLVKQPQVHVGPLNYKVVEHQHKQELTPAPVFPLIAGVFAVILVISLPRLKDLYLAAAEITPRKKETRKPVLRKRAN